MAVVTGINRCLVAWSVYLGPGLWIEHNGVANEPFDLPETPDELNSSFKKRHDDVMGMINNYYIGQSYNLNLGPGVTISEVITSNPTRKFSSLRGMDLKGILFTNGAGTPYNQMPTNGEVAIKGVEL